MFVDDRIPNFVPWRVRARSNARGRRIAVARIGDPGCIRSHDRSFDLTNDSFRLLISSVNHEPARTFRNPSAKENYDQTKHRADPKCAAPTQPDRRDAWFGHNFLSPMDSGK